VSATLTRLPNGLGVLTDPMPGLATAAVGVWVKVGTRWEQAHENGIAHFLEHLVFKGAGGRDARGFAEAAEARGIYVNAATGYERTTYHARALAEDAGFALDLAADLLRAPKLDPTDLAVERGVVMQEIAEAADDPEDRTECLHQEACFPDQPLGRPILGVEDTLARLTSDDARAFLSRALTADRVLVGAAGAINVEAIIEVAQRRFGDLPSGTGVERPQMANPASAARSERKATEQVHLIFSGAAPAAGAEGAIAARVAAEVLGGGMASRLFQDLRETRGLAYSIESWVDGFEDAGRLSISAGCAAKDAGEIAKRVGEHLERLGQFGPEDAELSRAKRILKAGLLMGAEGPAARCEMAVSQTWLMGGPLTLEQLSDRIDAVDAASVREAARVAAMPGARCAAAVGPAKGLAAARLFVEG